MAKKQFKCKNCEEPIDPAHSIDGFMICELCGCRTELPPEMQHFDDGNGGGSKSIDFIASRVQLRDLPVLPRANPSKTDKNMLNLVKQVLGDSGFDFAVTKCDSIIAANPSCDEAHFYKFLALNRCEDEDKFVSSRSELAGMDEFVLALACANDDKYQKYIDMFFRRAKAEGSFLLFRELVTLPGVPTDEVNDFALELYNDVVSEVKYKDSSCDTFDEIIKTITRIPQYIQMNKRMAEWLLAVHGPVEKAKQYLKDALDIGRPDDECLYNYFVLDHELTDISARDEFLLDENNREIIKEKLFSNGFNAYAAAKIYDMCLYSISDKTEKSTDAFDFMLSLIPSDCAKIRQTYLRKFTYELIKIERFAYAKKYNDMLIDEAPSDHEPHFTSVLINHKYINPFCIVEMRGSLYSDADYCAAMEEYAQQYPAKQNIYQQIVQRLKGLSSSAYRMLSDNAVDYMLKKPGAEHFYNVLCDIEPDLSDGSNPFSHNRQFFDESPAFVKRKQRDAENAERERREEKERQEREREQRAQERRRQDEEDKRERARAKAKKRNKRLILSLLFAILAVGAFALVARFLFGVGYGETYLTALVAAFFGGMFFFGFLYNAKNKRYEKGVTKAGFKVGAWFGVMLINLIYVVTRFIGYLGENKYAYLWKMMFYGTYSGYDPSSTVAAILTLVLGIFSFVNSLFVVISTAKYGTPAPRNDRVAGKLRAFFAWFLIPLPLMPIANFYLMYIAVNNSSKRSTGVAQIVFSVIGVIMNFIFGVMIISLHI